MNWNRLQTYGLSSDKAFEMLCNQLFENWCKETYKDSLSTFKVVNGSGGDGGVESYATLSNGSIIGLQAKWFPSRIESSQISQIRNSLRTAAKIRPEITKYIVCVPRDLASETGRGTNTESKRWDDFVNNMATELPTVTIELWTDTRITAEMQKPSAAGIHKYWFINSEIDSDAISSSFLKATGSWLSTKYVPDLNVPGQISKTLKRIIGDFDSRQGLAEKLADVIKLCKQFETATNTLSSICASIDQEMVALLSRSREKIQNMQLECENLWRWFSNEYEKRPIFDGDRLFVSFDSIIRALRNSSIMLSYHFHSSEVLKILKKLSDIDYYELASEAKACLCDQNIIILGNPGTGKTHGVSSFVEDQLNQHYHIPIITQARSIPENLSWRDIVINVLGLSNTWSEDELWQALLSVANRNRFQEVFISKSISLCPKVLIIVDGVDESSTHERWANRIKEANIISARYPQIKFCFTSRPTAFSDTIDYADVIKLDDGGDVPTFKLFEGYTKAYGITVQNNQWLRYALNTPLALKLFCELYEGQTISLFNLSDVSMDRLWREKINRIQAEYNIKANVSMRNQDVIMAITALSKRFVENGYVERELLISTIEDYCKIDNTRASKLLDHLESYGVVGAFCEKGTGLCPDRFFYYTGIQGYFDYALAVYLIGEYKHPSSIDFEHCGGIDTNTLYCLAVLSIQQYKYLITRNLTIDKTIDASILYEIQYYALQHSDLETAEQFRARGIEIMKEGADPLIAVVNRLVLPLSRIAGHPLGVSLLDEFLRGFDLPARRDAIWSIPSYLRQSDGKPWWKSEDVALLTEEDEEYSLNSDDLPDGLPVVYAWMLSSVSNPIRKKCRDELMAWALQAPHHYFSLFLHFANTNDPQIRSDLFSILMCLIYDCADSELTKEASNWILANVLSPSIINQNRDISVRYYSIAIIEKAKMEGLFTDEEVDDYLPPYHVSSNEIALNENALSGTRMEGYSAIGYDLARYVLIDHFESDFNSYNHRQLDALVNAVEKNQSAFRGMTSEQFILSSAYAFVLQTGWNEETFYNFNKDESGGYIGGVDCSLSASYHSATHGAQSDVMTICEKYVWQARNYISGFLCDRLLFGDDQVFITDYSMLDDFLIPIQEMYQFDPDNIPDDRPWYVPEPKAVIVDESFNSKRAISEYIKASVDIDWAKWIHVDNADLIFSIPKEKLLALSLYSCFYNPSGVRTDLFINSVIIPTQELPAFVQALHDRDLFSLVCNPTDWNGGVDSACYITPREICWFPWKRHYDSSKCDEFPNLTIHSAVDSCYYNYPEYNDVYYLMPSAMLRTMLGIVDTDGYHFFNNGKNVVSEYSIAGEKWRTTQEYLLVDEALAYKNLQERGLSLAWILQDVRRETGNAKERFGEFYAEKRQYSICYFINGTMTTEKLMTEFSEGPK